MQSLECYFYLIVFNAYLHEQVDVVSNFHIYCQIFFCFIFIKELLCFAVSSCLRVELQPVDVLPFVAVQVAGSHGPIRAVSATQAHHQRGSCLGEDLASGKSVLVFRIYLCPRRNRKSTLHKPKSLHASTQVADEYLAPDVLGTVKEMKAVNFRRVPKMPVYGVAQPTSEVQQLRRLQHQKSFFTLQQHLINKNHC